MNWNNLKNMECPKCGSILKETSVAFTCSEECNFFCSKEKFNEIVNSLYKPQVRNEVEDNQEALNNL